MNETLSTMQAQFDADAARDRRTVLHFRTLNNNDKLRRIQTADEVTATAIYRADIGMVDAFCRGQCELRLETLKARAQAQAVADRINKGSE